jgi:putative ABC transport system permease protein
MLNNYLKVAVRSITKSKLHAVINVAGMAIGMASVFLISLYIKYETGFDKYYPQHEDIYRITWEGENPQTRTPHPMAQALVNDFPEVESAVSLSPLWAAGLTRQIFPVKNLENDLKFDEAGILSVDTTFFDVFGFTVIRGDAKKALRSTNGILISESTAKKYFGDEDPIGKRLSIVSENTLLEVMAVFKDVPPQSHFHFDMLVSYVREKSMDPEDEYYTWADFGHFNYVKLKPGTDAKPLEAKLTPWIRKYIDISDEEYINALANNIGFRLQPVTDIHLKSHLRWELEPNGNIEYVYIMAAAALLTLVIACINFMNLMTAKSAERAKEIGIRKTLGALRKQLSMQFLSESMLMTVISLGLAVLIVEISLPFYKSLTGHVVQLNYVQLLPVLLLLTLVIGTASGIYPAVFLSAIQPQSILKGKFQTSHRGNSLRNGLIVFQFAISMVMITGAAVIFSQLKFIRNKSLGFDKEALVVIPLKDEHLSGRMETLKQELGRIDGVKGVTAASNMPGGQFNQNSISLVEAPDNEITTSEVFVDQDFQKTMDLQLVDGRFFSVADLQDTVAHFVLNETAARQLAESSVVGKEIHWHAFEDDRPIVGRVVGVVKDFYFQSFHDPLRPLMMIHYPSYNHLVLKLDTKDFDASIANVKKIYSQFDHAFEFEFSFLDDQLDRQYKSEELTATIFTIFAFLAIAIACFGLFGMAMLTFAQRTKEVSVRKVLGASVTSMMVLLLSDFTKLIVVAIVLATPIAWWMMDKWLDNFIYKVNIHPLTFVLAGLTLLVVAWMTLGYFTLRTSKINPSESLKAE